MASAFRRSLQRLRIKPLRLEQGQAPGEVQLPDPRGQGHTPSRVKEAELAAATPAWARDSHGALDHSSAAGTMAAPWPTATSGSLIPSSAGERSSA